MINPYAAFDCLSIGLRIQTALGNVSSGEVHLFAYLACLLSVYEGSAASNWGYTFAGTHHGSPYGPELEDARQQMLALGLLAQDNEYLTISDLGRQERDDLTGLSQNLRREKYLEAACSSLLTLPVGVIRSALSEDPMLKSSSSLRSTRTLFAGAGLELLYDHFRALSTAIGAGTVDLLVPATVWLTYLSRATVDKAS